MKPSDQGTLLGDILAKAYLEDAEYRLTLGKNYDLLQKLCNSSKDQLIKFRISDSFNSHMIQSYHAARARELLWEEMQNRFPNVPQLLWDMTHTLDYSVVFGLSSARNLFSRKIVKNEIGQKISEECCKVFDANFPGIKTTRDALAHDEDRVLGVSLLGRVSSDLSKTQSIGNKGTSIFCTNEKLEPFEFSFAIDRYFKLSEALNRTLTEQKVQ